MIQYRLKKHNAVTLFLLFGLLFPIDIPAQILIVDEDNIVTIKVPGIEASKLVATAKSGTLVRKGTEQWIARPNGEKDRNGGRKDFFITVFANRNGKKEILASKVYGVRKFHIIDYYNKATHHIKTDKLAKWDELKLKINGIEKISTKAYFYPKKTSGWTCLDYSINSCFYGFKTANEVEETKGQGAYIKVEIEEAWDTSGKKIDLPPIEITFE